jgi:hypothetical protein
MDSAKRRHQRMLLDYEISYVKMTINAARGTYRGFSIPYVGFVNHRRTSE